MPSLNDCAERHVEIDRRSGHYLCFPDIAHSGDGRLLCVYNEFDRHVGTRRRMLLRHSADGGRTWSAPQMLCTLESHCPRISRMQDGLLIITDDALPGIYLSSDHGHTWRPQPRSGLVQHGLYDRVLELDPETLFTTGHMHRGSCPQPKIRQVPTEQMGYISRNRGRHWKMHSIIACEKCLTLCEASVIRLPDEEGRTDTPPRLLALMRENSFVGEPMYACISEDGGATWGQPLTTPILGHRPTLGWTASGRLLLTYRDVGPDPGTKAWLGTLDELCSGFAVHGLHPAEDSLVFEAEGLRMRCGEDADAAVRFSLRPVTDPEFATASLNAEVLVREAEDEALGLYLGQWWILRKDGIAPLPATPAGEEPAPLPAVAFEPGRFHALRVDYTQGQCSLFVDGEHRGDYPVDRMNGATRPAQFGTLDRSKGGHCEAVLRCMELRIQEPRLGRDYAWSWRHEDGELPDAWISSRVLELRNDRLANPGDFGYSGWVELHKDEQERGGEFFCVYHHGDGRAEDYKPGYSAHVAGTRFYEDDFNA